MVLNYPERFLESLYHLWEDDMFCDICIQVGSQTFKAHRIVLSAGCDYFKAMFECGLMEQKADCVEIHDMDPLVFRNLLNFIYTGKVDIKEENCQDVLAAANMFGLQEIIALCCVFLKHKLHRENCLGIYQFAEAHACKELKSDAEKFINNHFLHLSKEEEFSCLPVDLLIKLLKSEYLCIEDEHQVLQAGLNWVLHDPSSRRKHIFDILHQVRIPIIPERQLLDILDSCSDLSTKVVIQKFVQDFHLERQISLKLHQNRIKPHMLNPRKCARKNIYVIGGNKQSDEWRWSDGVTVPTVEKFDTLTMDWTSMSDMQFSRSSHGAVVLNGQIYVVGGENDSLICDNVECYDPASNKWSSLPCLNYPRCGLGLCVANDCIYAFGGWVGEELGDSVEKYDPETNQWTIDCIMPTPRHAMGVLGCGGLIYLIGGLDADETDLTSVDSFNPVTKEWQQLPHLKVERSHLGVASLDGVLYAIGGLNHSQGDLMSAEKYVLDSDGWEEIAPLSDKRSAPCMAAVNGHLYVIGGQKWTDRFSNYRHYCSNPVTLDSMECYNPKNNVWSKLPYMPMDRCRAAAVVL
ncbi:actin-binding protein IPP-like [Pecten maximus]|uniref:actin-binding protein IPP-like n=1 Tax=Pecten maximus TaxID=6579 RepID=UPI001457F860|nr:actin-binding protein IPP-like [Pecten maximus]XP_033738172.1 actin-binding protein IPP-like [Pecten maximus]